MTEESVRTEEFKVNGDVLVAEIKKLLHEGNVRRIIIKTEQGQTLIEVPLTVGVVGGVVAQREYLAFEGLDPGWHQQSRQVAQPFARQHPGHVSPVVLEEFQLECQGRGGFGGSGT